MSRYSIKRGDTIQVHANVNSQHGDSALRVTISVYDSLGDLALTQTWRRHSKTLWFDSSDWQAYSMVTDLVKMLADACQSDALSVDEPDEPLF